MVYMTYWTSMTDVWDLYFHLHFYLLYDCNIGTLYVTLNMIVEMNIYVTSTLLFVVSKWLNMIMNVYTLPTR